MKHGEITRRAFLVSATTTALVAAAPAPAWAQSGKSANEKLNIAAIGAGGQARSDIMACRRENIVALCDVDSERAGEMFAFWEDVPKFSDYRKMLESVKDIDAVLVTTPDHTHAPAAYQAMKMGKHVYVQKPLTHTIAEARLLTKTAREMGVMTQMGNQGHSGNGARELCEMVWSGAIGQIREAHVWTNRPSWPQGIAEPLPPMDVPETLEWDLWLGTSAERPWSRKYMPHNWRGWQDWGSGALGDMACHIMDPVYWSLKLDKAPNYSVELVDVKDKNDQTFPSSSIVKYSFPAREGMDAIDVYWYDGGNLPPRPEGVPDDQQIGDGEWGKRTNGSYFVGEDGILTAGEYGGRARLLPDEKMADYTMPDEVIPRVRAQNHYGNWIDACKTGEPACSNFDYAGPFTEMVQFGNLVVKAGRKLEWDNVKGIVTNVDNPDEVISKPYRKGWELPV